MKMVARNVLVLLLAPILVLGLFSLPVAASGTGIVNVDARYSPGEVSVTGTVESGVLAVAIMIYEGDTLLRMETIGVTAQVFEASLEMVLDPGTYTVRVARYEGGDYAEAVLTVTQPPTGDGEGAFQGGSQGAALPSHTAKVSDGKELQVTVDAASGSASVNLGAVAADVQQGGSATVSMPAIPGVGSYVASVPAVSLSGDSLGELTMETPAATLKVPGNMFSGTGFEGDVQISLGLGDSSGLAGHLQEAVGDRPVLRLFLAVDGIETVWDNPDAPVTVSIPYTPSDEELDNPQCIVVWYIDSAGDAIPIRNGHYDPVAGTVTFSVTHFSDYAVAYNKVKFSDVPRDAWYKEAVSFIAARGITEGTGGGKYSPEARLTRGDFLVLMMRAYDIEPGTGLADNFVDAGDTYYTPYLGAARRLGIAQGVGENRYAPEKEITRQEMLTLLHGGLQVASCLPSGDSGKSPADFQDAADIEEWAQAAFTLFVKTGVIKGNEGRLIPGGTTTRAEMAQVLHNLLVK